MSKAKSSVQRLGILGGGQLARMLALSCHNLGIEPWVLSSDKNDPAAQVTARWVKGSLSSPSDIRNFAKNVDQITFESEFLDVDKVKNVGHKVRPSVESMGIVQDRLFQKEILKKLNIPTLDFYPVATTTQAHMAYELFHQSVVFKARRNGYDGYGTFIVKNTRELNAFLRGPLKANKFSFIAEPLVKFQREIAVMVGRTSNGDFTMFPWVETLQKNSRCFWVKGPLKLPTSRDSKVWPKKLRALLDELKYVGVMGVELFQTQNGLTINELAPRVHNSGHYSIDALTTSQFEWHVRAVMSLPQRNPVLRSDGFAMVNLLGSRSRLAVPPRLHLGHLHWYGKTEERPGRKMGHFNLLDKSPDRSLKNALATLDANERKSRRS